MRVLVLLFVCIAAFGQPTRMPFRTGTAGAIPSWAGDPEYASPLEAAPVLSVGQGVYTSYGRCLLRITVPGVRADYVYPSAFNRTRRWLILNAGGGRQFQWIGEPVLTPPTCSIPTAAFFQPAGYPSDLGNNLMYWSTTEDYVAYGVGGGTGSGSAQNLYEMRCSANCALSTATWGFTTLKAFGGNDGSGVPFIDWGNKTFCVSGTPPSCTKVADYTTVLLRLAGVSNDSDWFTMTLRGGTKSEYASCHWKPSTQFFGCRYLDVNGQLPTSSTPLFPGTSAKGNGPGETWDPIGTGFTMYQINGDDLVPGYVNGARLYRKPTLTTRVGDWIDAESISGSTTVGHGAVTINGVGSSTFMDGYGTCPRADGGTEVGWVRGYRFYSNIGSTPLTAGQPVPYRDVLYTKRNLWGGGWHVSSSPRSDRQAWVLSTFYKEYTDPCLSTTVTTFQGELVMHKTTTALAAFDLAGVTPIPYPELKRIGRHFSSGTSYNCQSHANISMDGLAVLFVSNMTGGLGGSGSTACGVGDYSSYMIVGLTDIVW